VLPPPRFARLYADFAVGQVYAHEIGKTVGESEHMQLTALVRNSHPLHFDEVYCQEHSFTKARVVYGGLVFAWIVTLASRDLAGNALWELGFDRGAHPGPVAAGDTLYALSKVTAVKDAGGHGEVTLRTVGVKNLPSARALERFGEALFDEELAKPADRKIKDKVFEIDRTLCVRKGSG
jgi:acyl dehydratase